MSIRVDSDKAKKMVTDEIYVPEWGLDKSPSELFKLFEGEYSTEEELLQDLLEDSANPDIRKLVIHLTEEGYPTAYSCQGRSDKHPAAEWKNAIISLSGDSEDLTQSDRREIERIVKGHTLVPFKISKEGPIWGLPTIMFSRAIT